MAQEIAAALQLATGLDAVGLRLRQGDDFPFVASLGYSDEFLAAENVLAERDAGGGLCRSDDGAVDLECTCGLVISGVTDPANPLFTAGGSSWTNDSLPFLDVPPDEDPRLHPRNRCIHVGFRSVALVPLRAGEEILGLLHLADRGTGRFTPGSVAFFEGLGASIGVALLRKQAEEELVQSAHELRAQLFDTVKAMGAIVGVRDPYTAAHELRVTQLALAIAAELGLDEERREGLALAGELHDIGKVAVPAEILSKPAALSEIEFTLVRQHAETGREILSTINFRQPVATIVAQHHERLDGSGYPDGLTGDEIMLEARILAVADVVEAMASHRPYRAALPLEKALAEIEAGAGTRYDAGVCAAAIRLFREQEFAFTE
jgi:putative nucleotidyltransferase with HDIG domain